MYTQYVSLFIQVCVQIHRNKYKIIETPKMEIQTYFQKDTIIIPVYFT